MDVKPESPDVDELAWRSDRRHEFRIRRATL